MYVYYKYAYKILHICRASMNLKCNITLLQFKIFWLDYILFSFLKGQPNSPNAFGKIIKDPSSIK